MTPKSLIFQTLQSNESLNSAQQNIYNELQKNECHGQHSRPVDFSITENEIRKAAIKYQFGIKLQMKW